MGNKSISIAIMLILLCSGFITLLSATAFRLNNDGQPQGALTKDNNNSFGRATELFNNSIIKDSVNASDDRFDFFKIKLRRIGGNGDRLNINLEITSSDGIIAMILFNPEFYGIGDSYCDTMFNNPVLRRIVACDSGHYYIVIVALFPTSININYDLGVNFSFIRRNIDTDNTNASANTATSGGSYSDTLNATFDYLDLYNIAVTSGTTTTEGLTVELSYYDDKYLAVYNPDGTLRDESDIIGGDPDDKEIVKFAANQTGIYRIAVGISGAPGSGLIPYTLTTDIKSGIKPDNDYDEAHAIRVYNGTLIDTAFDSEFDQYDYYVMELNQSDNLTVSILYEDGGPGDLEITIYEVDPWESINDVINSGTNKGVWTWGIAEKNETDYYIRVENFDLDLLVNYTILFSLNGENLWFQPMVKNDTNLDFSMNEDTIDETHVNLSHIFYDPDSPLTFTSPTHPMGQGTNIDIELLANLTVKFMPHSNFFGFEIVNFSASDGEGNISYWEVNVTVLPVNDPPVLTAIPNQTWTQGTEVNLILQITDIDDTEFTFYDNTSLFDVDSKNKSINFTPTNDQVGVYYINLNVSDGEDNVSTNFKAEIQNLNDPPQFVTIDGKPAVPYGVVKLNATEDIWNNYTIKYIDIDHNIGIMDTIIFLDNITDPAFDIDRDTGNISFLPLQAHVGTFYARITVDDGRSSSYQNLSITVFNVNDAPEKPVITLVNITNMTVNCSVAEVNDEDGDELNYTWSFGDGSGAQIMGRYANYTYSEPGNYTITLTVSDGFGGMAIGNITVDIKGTPSDGNKTNDTNGDGSGPLKDTDDDGLDDDWEIEHFGTLNFSAEDDFDNDGFSNLEEFEKGTDPTKATERPIDDKDAKDEKDALSSGMELFIYIVGIIAIINLILIIIIIMFFFMRKRPMAGDVEGRVAGPDMEGEPFTIPCPECGKMVSEDAWECPYCGEDLEAYAYKEGYEEDRTRDLRGDRQKARRREEEYEGDWEPEDEYEEDYYDDEYYEGEADEDYYDEYEDEEYYDEEEEPGEDEYEDEEYYEELEPVEDEYGDEGEEDEVDWE